VKLSHLTRSSKAHTFSLLVVTLVDCNAMDLIALQYELS